MAAGQRLRVTARSAPMSLRPNRATRARLWAIAPLPVRSKVSRQMSPPFVRLAEMWDIGG